MANPTVTLRIRADSTGVKASVDESTRSLQGLGQVAQQSATGLTATRRGVQSISAQLGELQSQVKGVIAAQLSLQQVTRALGAADTYQRLSAGLRLVEGSAQAGQAAIQDVYAIAQRQGSALDATAESYQRIRRAAALYGGSAQDAARMTETVSAALRINNASAAESASVLRQFSQAMGKGKVNGDEFMSLMENAPTLMDAVAQSMGKTKAELYAMSEAGTLTSVVFGDAVLKAYEGMTAEAAKMPRTMGQANEAMQNAFVKAAGESAQLNAALQVVNNTMGLLADNANVVLGVAVVGAAAASAAAFSKLGLMAVDAVRQTAVARAATLAHMEAEVLRTRAMVAHAATQTGASGAVTAALAAQTAAQTALTRASSVGAVALGALGGPVGWVTLAVTAAATAWTVFGESMTDAVQGAAEPIKKTTAQIIDELTKSTDATEKQIARLRELRDLKAAPEAGKHPNADALADASLRVSGLMAGRGGSDNEVVRQAQLQQALREYGQLHAAIEQDNVVQAIKKKEAALLNRPQVLQEYLKQYGDDAYRLNEALKKAQEDFGGNVPREIENAIRAKLGKSGVELVTQQVEFQAAKQKLINQDLLADVKSRVALQLLTEEEGAKETTRITIEEIQSRIQTERRLSAAYAQDPAKAAGHTHAAKLAAQELVNTQNAGARELQAIVDKRDKAYAEALRKIVGDGIERRQALESETQALQLQTEQARAHGIVIDSVATLLEREKAERYGVSVAMAEQNLQAMVGMGLSEQQIKGYADAVVQLRAMRDAYQEVANASGAKDLAQAGLEQTKRLGGGLDGAQEDPFKNWGNQLRETFATAGDGLARMVDAMGTLVKGGEDYAKEMRVIEALRNSGDDKNRKTADENELRLIKKTEAAQINAYASMAGAAKGYFGKQTAAYKVLHGAEQALRTYQLVMSAQTMAKDLAGIGAKVSAWLAGDTAIAASAMTSAGTQVAASTAAGTASAAAGVANQAKGDPYSAFARMAAMAAMMAALGFAVSGGGSGGGTTYDSFASQAANDGTGTVFGDSKAQSQSIQNSLQALESIARPELQYTSQMVMHLRSIDHALGGATGLLLSDGLLATDYQGVSTGKKGFLGFSSSSSSSSVSSEGVNFGAQSVAAAMQGVLVDAYRIIRTDWSKSSWWGLSKSSGTSVSTSWGDVTADVSARFTSAVADMRSTAIAAAQVLGRDTAAQLIDSLDTGLGKVEWKPDASFDDINKQISAVFSKLGDRMAQAVLPQIEQFALGGEGYLETLTRVSAGMEEAGLYADRFGLALASLSAVQGKSGDVAAELLRQTLVQSEAAGSGIAKILMSFTGGASDMADLYSSLQSVRQALVSMGQSAAAVTVDLLKGAGGMDALTSGLSDFESNFLTDTERAAAQQTRLAAEFARMGVLMPATAEQFKALVKTIDTSTAAGQKALGGLLSLSSGFKELLDTQASASKAAQDAADAAAKAQQDWIDKLQSAGKTISQWLTNLDSGNLSASTQQDKLASARGQYVSGLTLARGNNQEALSAITGQAQTYLQAARDSSSSESQYMAVLAQVKSELRSLPAVKSYEGQILDALALINTSVQTDLINTVVARFTSLDANVDGLLTYSELRTGLGYTDAQINALMAVVDSNGDGQISALEAQRAATLGVLGATQGVGSSTESVYNAATKQYQALVAMNNQTMYAVSYNTANMLTVLSGHTNLLQSMDATLAAIAATPPAQSGGGGGGGGGLFGNLLGGIGDAIGGFFDGIFDLFADGDVFGGQGIYNKPTAFTFDGGRLGVMGEAGPEAVMPLRRMSDGALGVRSQMHLVHHMSRSGADMAALVASLQTGFDRLAARIEVLDDNNNRGNAAIANATAKTAKVLDAASLGDALQVEVATA